MLYTETVSAHTLEVLIDLMQDGHLSNFFLVGGTALALRIGHRISIDIDLFSQQPFDGESMSSYLENQKKFRLNYIQKNTLKGQIEDIQVDLITHAYPLVKDIVIADGIRIASLDDIAAMKLNAIVGSGSRLKDFVDIAFLSSHLSLAQMIGAYEQKYSSRNPVMIFKALAYHEDINFNEPIKYLKGVYNWDVIKNRLEHMVVSSSKTFPAL